MMVKGPTNSTKWIEKGRAEEESGQGKWVKNKNLGS